MKALHTFLLTVTVLLSAPRAAMTQPEAPAIRGIVEAFDHADIVMLGERPWSKIDSDFRLQLVASQAFGRRANDIVVEFANARYQDLLDAYVVELKPVPRDTLCHIWRDAFIPGAWDSPVYEGFIEAVRRANMQLLPNQRMRILAGDPPIDWSAVHSRSDLDAYGTQGAHVIGVIEREVLARHRKALVIYGRRNLLRRDSGMSHDGNLLTTLEAAHPDLEIFTIATVPERCPAAAQLDSAIAMKERPALIRLDRSKIGAWPARQLFEYGDGTLAQTADGLLYLGPLDDRKIRPEDHVMRDVAYLKEVQRRKALFQQ
jgi:hypothetical protein